MSLDVYLYQSLKIQSHLDPIFWSEDVRCWMQPGSKKPGTIGTMPIGWKNMELFLVLVGIFEGCLALACTLYIVQKTIFKLIILKPVIKYKQIVKSYLFSAASLNYLKLLEYSCNHLLKFDEKQSLKLVKNVKTSEV